MKQKENSISVKASILCAIVSLITLIAYIAYGVMYYYFDAVVFATLLFAIVLAIGYGKLENKISLLFNLMAVALLSFGFGQFFLNSYEVWADRLNGIEMYGSRGTLFPVISIMVLLLIAIIIEIISCFGDKEVKNS